MKVENKTLYRTDHIRAIIYETLRRIPLGVPADWMRLLRVEVTYNRHKEGSSSGLTWLNKPSMRLMLPRAQVDKVDFAHTIAHEIAHTRGFTHNDMRGVAWYNRVGRWRELYAFAEEMPLGQKEEKGVRCPAVGLQERRYRRVLEQETTWARKLKLAQTKVKKLKAKRRYYERALAAKKATTAGPEGATEAASGVNFA